MSTVAEGGCCRVQAFLQERLSIMQLPARTGRSDAFEMRVLAHLSTVRGRRVRPAGAPGKRSLRPRLVVGASFPSYGATSWGPSNDSVTRQYRVCASGGIGAEVRDAADRPTRMIVRDDG